jgi:hypothetical protein
VVLELNLVKGAALAGLAELVRSYHKELTVKDEDVPFTGFVCANVGHDEPLILANRAQ